MVFDDEEIPDEWSNLQATIHSRTWIRHRSQPKIEEAIELAKDYLEDPDQPVKLVIFAMDIDTADEIADQLGEVSDHVYRAHSQLETSSKKNNETVQRNINKFGKCENGVLVSPKMLDEGIDVPDAEVGINVAGTKTKLQLVQRMGRVLRKHGDQRPHFHHFIAMPDENYLAGLDSKEYVQELNWVRELGRRSECSRSSRRPASTPNCWSAPNSVGTNCGPAIRLRTSRWRLSKGTSIWNSFLMN